MAKEEKPVYVGRNPYPDQIYYPQAVAPPPAHYEQQEGETTHLREYWNVILARRLSILAIAATVTVFALVSAFRQTPIYRATVSVQIDRDNPKILDFEQIIQSSQDSLETEFSILRSRTLAERVVRSQKLDRTETTSEVQEPSILMSYIGALRQAVSGALTAALSPKQAQPQTPEEPRESDAIDGPVRSYQASLTVAQVPRTRIVNISFDSNDPELAARIVNAHAEAYKEQNLELRFQATQEAQEFLKRELSTMKASLEKAEDALQAYSQQNQILFLEEGKNTESTKLGSLQAALTNAKMDRIQKESNAQFVKNEGGSSEAANAEIVKLRREDARLAAANFGENYSKRLELQGQISAIEKGLEKEKKDAIAKADAEFRSAVEREKLLTTEVTEQRTIVDRINGDIVHYDILKREADSNRELYDSLLRRLQEAGVSSSLKASNVHIVDRAKAPTIPIRPEKTKSLFRGVILGLVFGVAFAFFQNYMDNTLKSPADILRYLRLPTLAVVPKLTSLRNEDRYSYSAYLPKAQSKELTKAKTIELVSSEAPSSLLAEAYRSLRTSLILSRPDHPPQTILVASAVPSEGKTSTAANIAVSLSQVGSRVVLIDADMRRPRLHGIFSLGDKPGLSNFLAGGDKLRDVIYETHVAGLFVIPCGALPPNPNELITSSRFRQSLEALKPHFDYIVIDSPPLNNVSDGRVLARVVDGVILVVKALSTSRAIVARAVEYLDSSQSHILGVVLNDYDVRTKGQYYDYNYAGKYYGYGSPPQGKEKGA